MASVTTHSPDRGLTMPLSVRHAWVIIVAALLFFGVAGGLGADVQDSLSSGGFEDPGAESATAAALLSEEFGQGAPDLVLLVTTLDGSSVDEPAIVAEGLALTEEFATRDDVVSVASYWALGSPPPLRSTGGDRALVLVQLEGSDSERLDIAGELRHEIVGERGPVRVDLHGVSAVFSEVNEVIEEDLVSAELLAFPVTLILLILIFGSVVSALLPLATGGLAIIGTFWILELVAGVTEVSIFAMNFTTALGLGLAIDYALLVVNRYREELAEGHAVDIAVARTVKTAGRTVLFSGLTVASSLSALLVFQFAFLKSFAYAGIAAVGLSVVGATLVLPAVLKVLGPNVNRLQVRKPRVGAAAHEGMWHRVALFVMRRPIPVATIATLFLVVLGLPFLRVTLGFPDDRVLPPEAETRIVGDILRDEFDSAESSAVFVVARDAGSTAGGSYGSALSTVDGAARVDGAEGTWINGIQTIDADGTLLVGPGAGQAVVPSVFYDRFRSADATWFSVVPDVEPISAEGEALVTDIRAIDAPFDEVLVGGPSAELLDGKAGLMDRLPWALTAIALITFVVLFLSFGSLLMPLKAIVLNLLSLTATLGAMVWIFQDGRFEDLLGFTATGTLTITMPILLFCLAFGLSMDYEVFLLSRVKEEYDRTGDDVLSVANGLEATGRIVTAAAVLIAVVFIAFGVTGRVSFMILFGLGMTLAVLVDAFIVRATLVPAFMRLAGHWNWWAPAPLKRFHDRFGFSEHVDLDGPEPTRDEEPALAGTSA